MSHIVVLQQGCADDAPTGATATGVPADGSSSAAAVAAASPSPQRPATSYPPISSASSTSTINDSMSARFDTDYDEGNRMSGGCGSLVRKMNSSIRRTIQSWHVYRAHPCFWVSIPYAMLFVSVLSFGGIMVSYLKTLGCTDDVLAIGRGLAALMAIGPTFAVPYLIPRKGLYTTGKYMIWGQAACLVPIVIGFSFALNKIGVGEDMERELITEVDKLTNTEVLKTAPESMPLFFIILVFFAICTSRFGLWGFDLAQTQMMQELVDKSETGKVNGSQELVVNSCLLMSFVLTIIFHDPSYFIFPALISFGVVVLAAALYTVVGMRTTAVLRENAATSLQYA